jgi:hypothetical protein
MVSALSLPRNSLPAMKRDVHETLALTFSFWILGSYDRASFHDDTFGTI